MKCPSEGVLRAYIDQELGAAERQEFESHLENCAGCREQAAALADAAKRVEAQLLLLEPKLSGAEKTPEAALAGFKAQLDTEKPSLVDLIFSKRWRPAWVVTAVAAVLLIALTFPSGRGLAQRLLSTLRVERVQTVNLDFSSLEGNRGLQERVAKMLSEKVAIIADEKPQQASTAEAASQLAGFGVKVLGGREDTPEFHIEGAHAVQMTLDRGRLQDILDQSGRSDLSLPATMDGATVSVRVPRSVELTYGNCKRHREEGSPNNAAISSDCVTLAEAPSPVVNVPADLNLQQLAEVALELGGMSATQAREFCQTVDWRSTLVLPIPRFAGSYNKVEVDGAQGTLFNVSGHRAMGYVLIWVKDGMIYCLVGSGDSSKAVELANTLS